MDNYNYIPSNYTDRSNWSARDWSKEAKALRATKNNKEARHAEIMSALLQIRDKLNANQI